MQVYASDSDKFEAALREEREKRGRLEDALRRIVVIGTRLLSLRRVPTDREYIEGYCEVDSIARAALAPFK
jgi:hypothetical protein